MKIGIVCYPTYGGSGVVATELGIALSKKGHKVHFITYTQPARIDILIDTIMMKAIIVYILYIILYKCGCAVISTNKLGSKHFKFS